MYSQDDEVRLVLPFSENNIPGDLLSLWRQRMALGHKGDGEDVGWEVLSICSWVRVKGITWRALPEHSGMECCPY